MQSNSKIKKLEDKIKLNNGNIKRDSTNPAHYHAKARNLAELSELVSGDKKAAYQKQSLECYNKAIDLDTENSLYLADRSKLHVALGNNELAIIDVQTISSLPKAEGLDGFYVGNTIRDVARLSQIQDSIAQLEQKGTIGTELANILKEHANITSGLVVQVGSYGEKLVKQEEKLAGHDDRIEQLELLVKQLQKSNEISEAKNIELENRFKHETEAIKAQVAANTIAISGHDRVLEEHKRELDKLDAKLGSLASKLDSIKLEQLEKVIERSELQDAEAAELDVIKGDICKLTFYNSVRWQMNSLYVASSAITTGMLENQKTGTIGKIGSLLDSISSHIPFIGIGVQLFGEILQEVDKKDQEKNIEKYVELAVDNTDMSRLAEIVARKLALKIGNSKVGNDEVSKFMINLGEAGEKLSQAYEAAGWVQAVAESSDTGSIAKITASLYTKARDTVKTKMEKAKGAKDAKEYAKRFLENEPPEDPEVRKGEVLAKIVVKELTKSIYAGKIEELAGRPEEKAAKLTTYITDFYESQPTDRLAGALKKVNEAEQKMIAHFVTDIEYDDPQAINDLYMKHYDPVTADLMELLGSIKIAQHDNFNESDNLG